MKRTILSIIIMLLTVVGASAQNIAEGEVGTCQWYITSDSCLVIAPQDGNVSGDLPTDGWDIDYSDNSTTAPWGEYRDSIYSVRIMFGVNAKSCSCMFYGLSKMETIDLSNFNTQNVTEMVSMFEDCSSLTSLDLSNFNTQNVTNMSYMFYDCSSLTSLNLSNFNTQNVTYMASMFQNCSSLTSLDLSNFNTQNVTSMSVMFFGCSSLTSLDLSSFDTHNVTDMSGMFFECSALTSLDLSNFTVSEGTYTEGIFSGCDSLSTIISKSKTPTALNSSFFDEYDNRANCTLFVPAGSKALYAEADGWNELGNIEEKDFPSDAPVIPADAIASGEEGTCIWYITSDGELVIAPQAGATTGDLPEDGWNDVDGTPWMPYAESITSARFEPGVNATSLDCMFYKLYNLEDVDFTNFDTKSVTKMNRMFSECRGLEYLDLTDLNTENVKSMYRMIHNCSNLKTLNLTNFQTQYAWDLDELLQNCDSLFTIISDNEEPSLLRYNTFNYFNNCSKATLEVPYGSRMKYMQSDGWRSLGFISDGTEPTFPADVLAKGEVNTCLWYITADSTLVIAPTDGVSGDLPADGWGGSGYNRVYAPWSDYGGTVKAIVVEDGVNAISCRYMFMEMFAAESADLRGLNTENATDLSYMFLKSDNLKTIDITSLKTDNVENMESMFDGCYQLESIDVSGFNTKNVVSMNGMFSRCESLTTLDLSSFDVSNVTDMNNMFYYCLNLKTLDITNFTASEETATGWLFSNCDSLSTIISKSKTPTALKSGFFESYDNRADCTLLVPTGSKELYAAADGWNELGNIEEKEFPTDAPVIPADAIASGEVCTCIWYITSEGELVIAPADGVSGDLPDYPYSNYGSGTLADPFNVAAIQSVGSGLAAGQNSSTKYYIQGIVTSFKAGEEPGNSYGNSTFYIGDTSDASSTFYVYRCNGLNNGKFTSASDLMVGDTVVIYGTITNYNGTIETVQKEAYVYSVKHAEGNTGTVVPTPTPDPTPSDAIVKTCEEAKNIALALTENNVATAETYAITGYITSVVGSVSRDQQTFWIADTKDGGQVFEAYWANLPEGVTEFKVGQKVTIVGPLMKYNTTPEIKNAYVIILEDASDSDGDDTSASTSEGVSVDDVTVTLTNAAVNADTETVTIDLGYLGYENATAVETVTLSDGSTLTFDKGTNTNAPKFYTATNGVRVYANNTITFNGTKTIAKIVMTCDEYNGIKYVGNATATVSFDGKTAVYTNASTDTGTQLRVKTISITYAQGATGPADVIVSGEVGVGVAGQFVIASKDGSANGDLPEEGWIFTVDENWNEVVTTPWFAYSNVIKSAKIERGVNATSCAHMFERLSKMESIDLTGLNTDKVTDMSFMFAECSSLTSIDLSNFDTQNVTYMGYMFKGCSSLTSLDLSNFDTQNVTYMGYMFEGCSSLNTIISNVDTPSPLKIETFYSFDNRENCTLLVPEGSKSLYKVADGWNVLGYIEEIQDPARALFGTLWANASEDDYIEKHDLELLQLAYPDNKAGKEGYENYEMGGLNWDAIVTLTDRDGAKIEEAYAHEVDSIATLEFSTNLKRGEEYTVNVPKGLYLIYNIEDGTTMESPKDTLTYVTDYILGDVNGDKQHSVTDVVGLASYILKGSDEVGMLVVDINGDEEPTVTDITMLVDKIMTGMFPWEAEMARPRSFTTPIQAPRLFLEGKDNALALSFDNSSEFCSMQFDVTVKDGVGNDITSAKDVKVKVGDGTQGHSVTTGIVDGKLRVLVYSLGNKPFKAADVLSISVDGHDSYTATITNPELTTTSFAAVRPAAIEANHSIADGINELPSSTNAKVYDLTGRKLNAATKQGVVIVGGKKVSTMRIGK